MPFGRALGTKPSQTLDQLGIIHKRLGFINEASEYQIVVRRSHAECSNGIVLLRGAAGPVVLKLQDGKFLTGEVRREGAGWLSSRGSFSAGCGCRFFTNRGGRFFTGHN